LMGIVPVIAMAVPAAWSLQAPALVGPAVIAVAAAVLTVPSLVSYYAVEAPGIALGRRVNAGWRQARLRPSQTPP
jgi:peptidoglycan/LPS O-acetylase OafA/YrhL